MGVTSLLGMLCMEELNKMIETQADRQTNRERQRELHHDCYDCVLGTLHVGDEIREINGISVHGQTVEVLQKMLVRNSDFLFFYDFYHVYCSPLFMNIVECEQDYQFV